MSLAFAASREAIRFSCRDKKRTVNQRDGVSYRTVNTVVATVYPHVGESTGRTGTKLTTSCVRLSFVFWSSFNLVSGWNLFKTEPTMLMYRAGEEKFELCEQAGIYEIKLLFWLMSCLLMSYYWLCLFVCPYFEFTPSLLCAFKPFG